MMNIMSYTNPFKKSEISDLFERGRMVSLGGRSSMIEEEGSVFVYGGLDRERAKSAALAGHQTVNGREIRST